MRNKPFTRFLCMVLAVMCLAGGGAVSVGAASEGRNESLTDKSIVDYRETLNTISYEEYQATYFADAAALAEAVKIGLTDNWTFVNDEVVIIQRGTWTMHVINENAGTFESVAAAEKAGYEASRLYSDGKIYRVIKKTYTSLDDVPNRADEAHKNNPDAFNHADLAYVTVQDGKKCIYTPARGAITWDIDLSETAIKKSTLVSIAMDYYPIANKAAAIEREFYINGTAPYSESRSLRFAKIWSSYQDQNRTVPMAQYTAGDDQSLKEITAAAEQAGFVKDKTYFVDKKTVTFHQPEVVTAKNSAFAEKYALRFYKLDINRNEIRPTQLQDPEWTKYILSDSDGFSHTFTSGDKVYNSTHFGFVIAPDANGKISIKLDGVNEPMELSAITFMPYESALTHQQYQDAVKKAIGAENDVQGKDIIKLEAEDTRHTSTNVVYPIEDRTSALCSPVDTTRTLLNTIGSSKWSTPGQWVEYSFSVESAGWYDIYSRFKQSYLDGMYVSRSLEIFTDMSEDAFVQQFGNDAGYYDGLPFAEAAKLRYDYGTDWQVSKLTSEGKDKSSYQVYFRAGVTYTLRIQVTLGSMSDQVREIERILNALNTCYLDIIKLTGTTPDAYRSYDFYRVLPDTLRSMVAEKDALKKISESLRNSAGVASTYTGICDKLVDLLERMVEDGGEPIAKNLDTFKSYVGSLGTFLSDAKTQPLQLDYMMIQPSTAEAPAAAPNFFQALWHEILSFIQSFFRDYNSMGATQVATVDSKPISVWVPYGRDQANVIRNMSTNDFTGGAAGNGIAVDLKLVTAGTLLPSILAGIGPDVYHGLDDASVINYAIRGALAPLEGMENFEATQENFTDAARVVLSIADADDNTHYYGLPETQNFSMMFVRLDVLADLGVEIPKTWEDLYEAQTTLQANNMEIGVGTEYKFFLYQMGGDLWADDGMRINLDSTVGLQAFETMCNMFTQLSFPYTYDAANRFRTGEMPIIIAGYTVLYNQLKVFATELDGCWTFVPVPGTTDEDGNIHNESISSVTAIVMIDASKNKTDAWKYMTWYTGAEAQEDYATEMVAIIGDSAKHPTANRYALEKMPWTYDEYVEVENQFSNLASVKNYPGYYFVDRYTAFAFLAAYNEGADPSTEILSYINIINTEITRKRQEFKLETLQLGQNLAEKRLAQANEALELLIEKYNKDAYKDAIESARYAIANASSDDQDYLRLEAAANAFFEAGGLGSKEQSEYFLKVSKQTLETDDGGYSIDSLSEAKLVYFLSEALRDAAKAFASY